MDQHLRKLTHAEIVERQAKLMGEPRLKFDVIVHNIRSLHNVGAIFRTADGVGVNKIWLTGFTGYPPQSGISKTALGAEQSVLWEYRASVVEVIAQLRSNGYQMVLLEQMHGSIKHDQFVPKSPVCLILGNEIEGVNDQFINLCDAAVEIEMAGAKNSLNVAVAFGIIAYHIRTQLLKV